MNKSELTRHLIKETDLSKDEVSLAVKTLLEGIMNAVNSNKKVTLFGFGTFMVNSKKARKGRNPQTGESIDIPATKTVKFIPGKVFREYVNDSLQ